MRSLKNSVILIIIALTMFFDNGFTFEVPVSVITPRDHAAQYVQAGKRMDYYGTSSYDPDGGIIIAYKWFLNGQLVGIGSHFSHSFDLEPFANQYNAYGNFNFKLYSQGVKEQFRRLQQYSEYSDYALGRTNFSKNNPPYFYRFMSGK